jgi:hypothetical protein
MYKLFYCFNGEESDDAEVSAEDPIVLDDVQELPSLLSRAVTDGDFLGLTDADGNTLQLMYEGDEDRYWLEIPVPAQGGSYGKHYSLDGIREVFRALPPRFDVAEFPGLRFESW